MEYLVVPCYVVESYHPNDIYLPAKDSKMNEKWEKNPKSESHFGSLLDHFGSTLDVFKDGHATSKAFKKLWVLSDFWAL